MRSSSTFGIHFLIRQDKIREGKAPLYVRITVNKDRVLIGLKEWVEPRSWDARKGIGKGSRSEIRSLNDHLLEIRTELGECYRELQLAKKPITAESIKAKFQRADMNEHTLSALFAYHNEKEKHKLNENTLSHYVTSQRYMNEFILKHFGKRDLYLVEVNYKFISDFENFLRDYKPSGNKKPIGNTGAMTHLVRLKKMLNLAIALDWINKNPFKNIKIRVQNKIRQCLDQEELLRMESKEFRLPRLDLVRDIFVFCCYTGLSYIDVYNLEPKILSQALTARPGLRQVGKKLI